MAKRKEPSTDKVDRAEKIINEWWKDPSRELDLSDLGLEQWPLTSKQNDRVIKIRCGGNRFSTIPKLSHCTHLFAPRGELTKVGTIPKIQDLHLSYNRLSRLPGLTKCLRAMVDHNQLTHFPTTINKMEILDISNNPNLSTLKIRAAHLRVLIAHNCNLNALPNIPKLQVISIFGNDFDKPPHLDPEIKILHSPEEITTDLYSLIPPERPRPRAKAKGRGARLKAVKPREGEVDLPEEEPEGIVEEEKPKIPPDEVKEEVQQERIWEIVPQDLAPIKTVSVPPIKTRFSEGTEKIIERKERTQIRPEEAYQEVELEVREEDLFEIDQKRLLTRQSNMNRFIENFDLSRLPQRGKGGGNIYRGTDIIQLARLAGIQYTNYSDTINRLLVIYVRQKNLLVHPEKPELNIISQIVKIGPQKGKSPHQIVSEWYHRRK